MPKTRRRKVWLWVILALVILGIIGSIGGNNNQPSSNQKPLPAATTSAPATVTPTSAKSSPVRSAHHAKATPVRTAAPTPKAVRTTRAPVRTSQAPVPVRTSRAPAPASCTPVTSSGHCYEPGEFCRKADRGRTGIAGDREAIVCADNNGWRWEAR